MRTCFQFQGQDVLEHGIAVADWFGDLYAHLFGRQQLLKAWRIPNWLTAEICQPLQGLLPPLPVLARYQRYHDCGKPLCRIIDEEGRQHFPNHAAVSAAQWLACGGDSLTADLIRQDMDLHLLKAEDLHSFSQRPTAFALLLTALAEIHANCMMFGGLESHSFKIKLKHLDRRGKQIIALLRQRAESRRLNSQQLDKSSKAV